MDSQVDFLRSRLAAWAELQPGLRKLWIYGSRALGTHRPDSDLDIAFEIDRLADQAAVDEFHEHTLRTWREELKHLSGFAVHLEANVGDASNVAAYVEASGFLVYERHQQACVLVPSN